MKTHLDFLQQVAEADVIRVKNKEKDYGSSWKKRGGIGAFMMLCRKWDRIEKQMEVLSGIADRYDIFTRCEIDKRDEGLLDDINDLAGYLLLVRAELISRQQEISQQRRQALVKEILNRNVETTTAFGTITNVHTIPGQPCTFGYTEEEDLPDFHELVFTTEKSKG
jgi:hypothetical protein